MSKVSFLRILVDMVLAKAILMIFVKLYSFLIIESIYVMMKLYGPVETQTHNLCLWQAYALPLSYRSILDK